MSARSLATVVLGLLLMCCSAPEQTPTSTDTVATTESPQITAAPSPSSTASATPSTTLPTLRGLAYVEVATGLGTPTDLRSLATGIYFTTKEGIVWALGEAPEPVLDISDRVTTASSEQGLLSMAGHPEDADRLFIHYSGPEGDTTISEFRSFDPASERVLVSIPQPAANHNGGTIAFGPDGLLWIGLGDGGGAGDAFGTAQATDDLLGNILRLDVDAGDPEVWAIGLRNPWRFSFDDDLVYIADVGQNAFEEINVARSDVRGLNYGWPITEGLHCFAPPEGCDLSGLTPPVLEVSHSDSGTCAIAGGVVYRGPAIPELAGHYFYSDYCGGWLRSFRYDNGQALDAQDWTASVGEAGNVISFGTDPEGEIFVLTDDRLLRIVPVR